MVAERRAADNETETFDLDIAIGCMEFKNITVKQIPVSFKCDNIQSAIKNIK